MLPGTVAGTDAAAIGAGAGPAAAVTCHPEWSSRRVSAVWAMVDVLSVT